MEQPGGRGYLLKSRLREPKNPLSLMARFHRAVRYCSLRYSAALFAYIDVSVARIPAVEPAAGLPCSRAAEPARGVDLTYK